MLLLGLEIAIPCLVGAGVKLYQEWRKKEVLREIRTELVNVVNNVDDVDDPLEAANLVITTKKLKKRLRYHGMPTIVKAVQYAEMKVGLLKDNPANRMVIDKIIRDFMVAPKTNGGLGMRVSDAVKNYRVAVSMYFKPRAQAVILDEVDKLDTDHLSEAYKILGLDGSA